MEEDSQGSSDTQMERKKAFIQAEIVDKKYEVEEFTNYIRKVKGDEDINLSKWTFKDIKSMVEDFQHDKDAEKKKDQLENIPMSDKSDNDITVNEKSIKDEDEQPDCFLSIKQEKGVLSDYPNLTVQITNIEKLTSYFFMTDYQFTIEVIELSSKVTRTMSDFEWLKDTLEMYYPTTYIPPLPKFALFSLSKPNYLKRKGNYLKMFLSFLSQNPLIISSKVFNDFLKKSKEDLIKLQKEYEESDPPTKIKRFPTMEGMISVTLSKAKDIEAERLRKNIADKSNCYIKLNNAIKDIIAEFTIISTKMTKLSEAFTEIAKVHSDIPYVQRVYTDFEELTKRYANSYLNQQNFFKEDLQQYFKYTNKMFNHYTNFIDDFAKTKNEYLSQFVSLGSGSLKKREVERLDSFKKQYGYCLNRVINEHNKLKIILSDSLGNHLKNINNQKEKMFEDYLAFVSLLEGKRDNISSVPHN